MRTILRHGERYVEVIDGCRSDVPEVFLECFMGHGFILWSERVFTTRVAAQDAAIKFLFDREDRRI